ncbi:hypothetical protein BH23BAC3_BH23BAC3_05000 [soil metagenome]
MKLLYFSILSLLYLAVLSPDLFAQKPVAGEITKLIELNGTEVMNPKWSPDGQKIAFTSARQVGLWVAEANGNNVRQITDDESVGHGYSWSHDSSHLLARHSQEDGPRRTHAVKLYSVDTEESFALTEYRNQMPVLPSFSANQERVVLPFRDNIEEFSSGLQTQMRKSPAGDDLQKPVVVNNRTSIKIASDIQNGYETLIPFEGRTFLNATASPDGERIAFEVMGGNLYVMDIDGSNIVDLGKANRPEWSPDGRYIAAMLAEDDGHYYLKSDIVAFTTDGSECLFFTTSSGLIAMSPSWSPDGTKIAFHTENDNGIYVLELQIVE